MTCKPGVWKSGFILLLMASVLVPGSYVFSDSCGDSCAFPMVLNGYTGGNCGEVVSNGVVTCGFLVSDPRKCSGTFTYTPSDGVCGGTGLFCLNGANSADTIGKTKETWQSVCASNGFIIVNGQIRLDCQCTDSRISTETIQVKKCAECPVGSGSW